MTEFLINVYSVNIPRASTEIKDAESLTDAGQSQTVREILTRFAREGVTATADQMSARYADEFADDIDINDPRVDNLLDQPDLSDMNEMEIADYVRDNSEQIDVNSLNKEQQHNEEDPPPAASTAAVTQTPDT